MVAPPETYGNIPNQREHTCLGREELLLEEASATRVLLTLLKLGVSRVGVHKILKLGDSGFDASWRRRSLENQEQNLRIPCLEKHVRNAVSAIHEEAG